MPQIDGSPTDLAGRVGATALGIAAARAAETASDHPLIRDPFAQAFVDAAGIGVWNVTADSKLLAELTARDPGAEPLVRALINFTAVRTAFLDEFFLDAAREGVRQIVNLAAGLDSRAWRLPWPDGTTVYELDQPMVLDFKYATLRRSGAMPTSRVIGVPVDLREDWPTALQQNGFDAAQPTAWLAEGLLHYLLDEPICMIVPQRRAELEEFSPELRPIESDAELHRKHEIFLGTRGALGRGQEPADDTGGERAPWQSDYTRGRHSDGEAGAEDHQTRRYLRPFVQRSSDSRA